MVCAVSKDQTVFPILLLSYNPSQGHQEGPHKHLLSQSLGRTGKTGHAELLFQTQLLLSVLVSFRSLGEQSCFFMAAIMPVPEGSQPCRHYFSFWRLLKVKSHPPRLLGTQHRRKHGNLQMMLSGADAWGLHKASKNTIKMLFPRQGENLRKLE